MIEYQIKDWLLSTFSYHGTVWPRVLLRVLSLPLLASSLLYARQMTLYGYNLGDLLEPLWLSPLAHTLTGTALSLVLVFRNNASYDRYWEGRKQWGSIVNASRNLARSSRSYGGDLKTLAPLLCAYPYALKAQLRMQNPVHAIKRFMDEETAHQLATHPNPALAVNLRMSDWLQGELKARHIIPELAQRIEKQIATLMDCQGACERILKTPVPFAHVIHVRQLLFFYLLSLPFVLIPAMGWTAVPAVTLIGLGLLGIEEAGVEIENPFGDDPNDLPLNKICDVIRIDVMALISFDDDLIDTPEVSLSEADESLQAGDDSEGAIQDENP